MTIPPAARARVLRPESGHGHVVSLTRLLMLDDAHYKLYQRLPVAFGDLVSEDPGVEELGTVMARCILLVTAGFAVWDPLPTLQGSPAMNPTPEPTKESP